nr:hypothetical protein [Tanacetum cinerariifolium]
MPNHDSSVIISSKIDSLFDEFTGELTLLKSFPLGIDKTDCHPKKEIHFAKRLLYNNSSPRPPEEIVSDNSNADIESFSPSPIPNEDSDSHMEEIDLYLNPDDPMPPGIKDDDDDSERDVPILEELLDNYSISLPANDTLAKIKDQMTSITSLCEMACQVVQKKLEEKQIEEERAAKAKYWKLLVCYDDDNDEERSDSLSDNIISGLPPFSAITPNEPVLSTEEPDNSLCMGDEHLDTIPAMKSDEFIKSGVENLIPIPSESEGIPEHMCDVPSQENSSPLDISKDQFEDLSESNEEFSSTDDNSFSLDNIDYVEASPPDSELISSEVMEIIIPEVGGIEASNDNPIPFYDPIILGTPPNLTQSGESDLFLEVDAFLAVEDEFPSSQSPKSYLDSEGDMLLFEAFLNIDHSFDFKTKSSSTSLNSLLEETNNFDNSLPEFTTFSKVLFDAECESDSSDDQSSSDEDILKKIISKPLSEEEIIPMESLRTHDSSLPISSKIDSLLDEFVGELTLLKSIPPGINETDCDFEEDIRLIEKSLYDNSSPRPPKEFVSTNSDAAIKSFSSSPILVKDSDILMEEIDLF